MSEPAPQSVVQATGKVATSIIDGLKAQPAMLVLVLLNIFILGMLGWLAYANAERRQKRETMILERCLPKLQSELSNESGRYEVSH